MKFQLISLIFCVVAVGAFNVPETNSKRCFESSFCRRTRGKSNPFETTITTLVSNDNGVEVDLYNTRSRQIFRLKLDCLESNTFHFEIDEKFPLRPRFRLGDQVVVSDIKKKAATVASNLLFVNVTCDANKAVIYRAPFKIEFYEGDQLAVTINNRQLMTFEHLRENRTLGADEDAGSWEEMYDGVIDSKPNGPEAVAMDFTINESKILFGIPVHHDTFALRRTLYGEPYRLFTTDTTLFELDSRMPNYGVVPVIYGHTEGGKTAGIFWHNSADTYVDIYDSATSHFMTESGIVDVYVLLGPTPQDAFAQYTKITGVGNLPQLFTLAYHQCRWSYMSQAEVLEIVANFDKYDIPLDTMWLDIDYTDGKRYFTWNHETFPTPLEMMSTLNETGRHLVFIIDPHIKIDDDYFFYRELTNRSMVVKLADQVTDFEGKCWPGDSVYIDFLNPEARSYYADQYLIENFKESVVQGGVWNDMNEPAVFEAPEKTFPRDATHFDGEKFWEHRDLHNIYGLLQTKATYDGLTRRGGGEYRPFILTRSFFAGSQKYTAVWTGDNTAGWDFLHGSIQSCLAISVAGVSFCGSDIGGFFFDPEEELFYRWNQAAAFQPFMRNHASAGTKYREPWTFSNGTRDLAIEAIKKRYTFLPMWYTLFYEHELTGLPVMRPMLTNYPLDHRSFALDTQYMLSDKLLVAPVLEPLATSVVVRFPSIDGKNEGELWYDIDDYTVYRDVGAHAVEVDEHKLPVFQRGGTIIPRKMQPQKASIYMRNDPLTLFVAVDKSLHAHGNVYIDDETSFAYRDGKFLHAKFDFVNDTLKASEFKYAFETGTFVEKVYFAGLKEAPKVAKFRCKSDVYTLDVEEEGIDFYSVEIDAETTANCRFTFDLVLSGTAGVKSVVSGVLLIFVAALHALRNFF